MRKKQGGSQRHREEMGNPTHPLLSDVELIRLWRLLEGWLANTTGLGFSFWAVSCSRELSKHTEL